MAFKTKAKKAPETFHFEHFFEEKGGTTRMADDMRNLAQEIINSFDARVGRVKALKHETAAMLKGFRDDFRRKAADLKRFLSNAEASRMREFRTMHQGIMARQEERNGEVAGMLGGFRRENEAAASHWQHMAAAMAKRRATATR